MTSELKPSFAIDGERCTTLETFYDEIGQKLLGGAPWGRNLDAPNDVLHGRFGQLPSAFAIMWRHSAFSRSRLNHAETARQLRIRLARCHPSSRETVRAQLAAAEQGEGPTVFDWLVKIIRRHPNVELTLI